MPRLGCLVSVPASCCCRYHVCYDLPLPCTCPCCGPLTGLTGAAVTLSLLCAAVCDMQSRNHSYSSANKQPGKTMPPFLLVGTNCMALCLGSFNALFLMTLRF
jgi:hypothetical protein